MTVEAADPPDMALVLDLLINACADFAANTPNPLPGEVSDENAAAIAIACGKRVIAEASEGIRNSFGAKDAPTQ